jgi:exocyst complex component 4
VSLDGPPTLPTNRPVRRAMSWTDPVLFLIGKFATVTMVEFENEPPPSETNDSQSSPVSPSYTPSRLSRYLHGLVLRPNDSPHVERSSLSSRSSMPPIIPPNNSATDSNIQNPEADSFAYMETLLESLAVLGKLGNALDIVSQRLPAEIYSLVETTLEEVGERAEYNKRGSTYTSLGSSKSDGVYSYTPASCLEQSQLGDLPKASCLRLTALESSAKEVDHEILKDFFWTVYSKLDAVSQGLRLVYEVSNRIGSVS